VRRHTYTNRESCKKAATMKQYQSASFVLSFEGFDQNMVFFCHSKSNWLHHVVSTKQHKRPVTSNNWSIYESFKRKKLFWMNCTHDFQIKQRITNRNTLLEYDIRNIVALVREPIMLIKLLEDFLCINNLSFLWEHWKCKVSFNFMFTFGKHDVSFTKVW
jgi:hypothetical protein